MSYLSRISQNVTISTGNSYTGNIAGLDTYTGTSESTLGIVGIQTTLKTDQNCIVYVDQSPDGSNWDVVDNYNYYSHEGGKSWTTQAVNSYLRTRVNNTSSSTTSYFRLQTALCPIVEAVPRSLDDNGYFQVGVKNMSDEYGFEIENTPMGEMRVVEPYRLVGTSFIGTTLDTNFWTGTLVNSGTITQSGCQVTLSTNTALKSGSAVYQTVRKARYVGGNSNRFRAVIQLGDAGEANNSRKWGAFDGTDGAYFELDGTTLYTVTSKAGTATRVASSNWNEDITVPSVTSARTYEIYWTNSSVWFSIADTLKHKASFPSNTWTNTINLPVRLSTTNSDTLQTNKTLQCRVATIYRLGPLRSNPIYKNITSATTTICKYGAGTLHSVIINNPSNNNIIIYDNTAGSGTIIGTINPGNGTLPFQLNYDCPFFDGLTIVTAGTANVTVIYE